MRRVVLDAHVMEQGDVHTYLAEKLDFPDYYGRNLDALHDCLGELRDTRLVVTNLAAAAPAEDSLLTRALRVLADAARENPGLALELADGEAAPEEDTDDTAWD